MGIFDAISNALNDTYASQVKHKIHPDTFHDYSIIVPGVDENGLTLDGELVNGSIIVVPDNTCAVILDHDSIEGYITDPGQYVYEDGACSVFNGDGIKWSFTNRLALKLEFNGKSVDQKRVIYVNLKDIRNIMFGTYAPILYHDSSYNADLEITAHGWLSIRIHDPIKFYTEFVPLSTTRFSADDDKFKMELGSIILQALTKILNKLSGKYSIKEISSCSDVIRNAIMADDDHVFYWNENYGFELTNLVIESIDYSEETKRMIKASNRQSYENRLQKEKRQEAINLKQRESMTFEDQYEAVLKLSKLKDMGVLTESEFEKKKKEIMGL